MPEGLIFAREGRSLVPVAEDSDEWLQKRKAGEPLSLEPVQLRNVKRLKLYWVICGIVAEQHEELTHKNAVDEAVRHLTGHFEVISWQPPSGPRVFVRSAKSIAIANMKEYEFEQFLDRVLRVIESQILPGVDIDGLRKEAYVRAASRR